MSDVIAVHDEEKNNKISEESGGQIIIGQHVLGSPLSKSRLSASIPLLSACETSVLVSIEPFRIPVATADNELLGFSNRATKEIGRSYEESNH